MEHYSGKKIICSILSMILVIQLAFGGGLFAPQPVFAGSAKAYELEVPENIETEATDITIKITWDEVEGAENYEIENNGNVIAGITVNEHIITGLEPNTEYSIRVRALNKNSVSQWSNTVIQKTEAENPGDTVSPTEYSPGELEIPTNITYSIDSDEVVFNWDEVTGAESYDVEINSSFIDNVTVAEYVYDNIQPESEYAFRVRSVNSITNSAWSEEIRVSASEESVEQKDVAPPEEELLLEEQDPVIGNGNGLEGEYYDNRTLKDLVFIRKDREINFDWGTGTPDPLIKKNAYSIRWTGKLLAEYTAEYTLYTYTGDGVRLWLDDELIIDDWKSSATRENEARVKLTAGQKYDIKIEYFNNNKESIAILSWASAYKDKEVIPMQQLFSKPDTPSNISTLAEGSKITVTWDNTLGAESYQIEADGEIIENGMETEYVQVGLAPNTEHTYRIRAVNDVSAGDWTEPVTKISAPATPENLSAVADTTNILVSWDPVVAAAGYDIEVNGIVIDNGDSTSYLHDGLNPNTKCTYRVRAKNENGISYWSELLTRTTLPATPENVNVEPASKSMKLSWDAVDGAITYEIEADGQVVPGIKDTNYTFEGLTSDTAYTYKVRARNIEGGAGYWSEPITRKTLLETPAGITSDITDRSVSLAWLPVTRAIGYEIEIDGTGIIYTTELTFVNEGLLPNSEHSYRIRAKNDDNISEWSEKVIRLTLPDIPKNLISDSTSYTITVSWEKVDGAISYDIEADGRIIDSTPDTTYIHQGLQPMTEYNYRVRAVSIAGAGYWSQPISDITKVGVPANINALSTSRTITFTWDEVSEADRYEIELDGVIYDNGSDNAYKYDGLMPNSAHTYRVRAVNETGNGDWSELKTKYTAPDIPGNVKATSTSTTISLTWDAVEAAGGYDVEINGTAVDVGNSTTYIHAELYPNTQRAYKVRAKNSNGIGDWSKVIAKTTLPDVPSNIIAEAAETAITLRWDSVAGADQYDIMINSSIMESTTVTEYVYGGLTPNTEYSFNIRAKNAEGAGEWSETVNKTTMLGAPQGFTALASETSIILTWQSMSEGTAYDVEVDGTIIDNGIETSFAHQDLVSNTQHIYRIRAKTENSVSRWSEALPVYTLPIVPTNLKVVASSNEIDVAWDMVEGVIGYELEADGTIIETGLANTYQHLNLTPNSTHIYKIRTVAEGGRSAWSDEVITATLLGIPQNITASVTNNSATLTWDTVEGANSFEVDADGIITPVTDGTSYTHTGLNANSVHVYRVRAKNGEFTGEWSTSVTALTMLNAPANIKLLPTANAITLTWDTVADAESYEVETNGMVVSDIKATMHQLVGLTPNTEYIIRVKAKNEMNTSDWSANINQFTTPDVPLNLKATSTIDSTTVVWDAVYGAVGYDIEVDGTMIDTGELTTYTNAELTPNTQHVYRVRSKNASVASEWSIPLTETTLPEMTISLAADESFNFMVVAPNKEDVNLRTITVTYNPDELEVLDIYAATSGADLAEGKIQGTDFTVTQFTPGKIVLTIENATKTTMNIIKFKAKANLNSSISYEIE